MKKVGLLEKYYKIKYAKRGTGSPTTLRSPSERLLSSHSQNEIHNHRSKQEETEHGGAKTVIIRTATPPADGSSTPMVSD